VTADSAATAAVDTRRGSGSARFRPALPFYPQDLKNVLQNFNSMYHFDTGFLFALFKEGADFSGLADTPVTLAPY
jgi:hypothetical protein